MIVNFMHLIDGFILHTTEVMLLTEAALIFSLQTYRDMVTRHMVNCALKQQQQKKKKGVGGCLGGIIESDPSCHC